MPWTERTRLLLGDEAVRRLQGLRVILFGVGGVGSWCAEALARAGVGSLTLVDFDRVSPTNINRQLPALHSTVGQLKVDVLRQRLLDINPKAEVQALPAMYTPDGAHTFALDTYDYVIDAIDSLPNKAHLLATASRLPRPRLLSSMGAARRCDPLRVRVGSFNKVRGCPLARALRGLLKRQGLLPLPTFQCVYSEEPPQASAPFQRGAYGSLVTVTAAFGLTLASLVINDTYSYS